jgi:hypothetical protein
MRKCFGANGGSENVKRSRFNNFPEMLVCCLKSEGSRLSEEES